MRTRRGAKSAEADPNLEDLLQNLHKSTDGAQQLSDDGNERPVPGQTLGDVSKQSVGKLLDRVGVRRAAAKKRQLEQGKPVTQQKRFKARGKVCEEDDLFHQRPGSSADAPICGTRAKVSRDAEDCHMSSPPRLPQEEIKPSDRSDAELAETVGEASNNDEDDECEWEQGEDTYDGSYDDKEGNKDNGGENGWTGDITIQLESKVERKSAAQRKPPVRRANAKDKEFAELVHKSHLLCLLGRGRMIDAACDDALLQASILSVLPPSLNFLIEDGDCSAAVLERLVSWFSSSFRVLSPGEGSSTIGQEGFAARLLESVQQQAGTQEEVAALSVAFFRGLGFTSRYVASLNVTPLKPDASSLEASVGWEPRLDGEGITFSAHSNIQVDRVTNLARKLAQSLRQVHSTDHPSPSLNTSIGGGKDPSARPLENEVLAEIGKLMIGGGNHDGEGSTNQTSIDQNLMSEGKQKIKEEVKAYTRRGRKKQDLASGSQKVGGGVKDALSEAVVRKDNKGDEEFETQVALAMCATAAASREKNKDDIEVIKEESTSATKRLPPTRSQKQKGGLSKLRQRLGMRSTNGGECSRELNVKKMGSPLHWAEIYQISEDTGKWIHVDAARGWSDGAAKVEGAAIAGRVPLRYVIAFAGTGAKDVTRRYVGLWSSVSALRVDEGWWASTLRPLKQLEAAATAGATLRSKQAQSIPSSSQGPALDKVTVPEDNSVLSCGLQKPVPRISETEPIQSTQDKHEVSELKTTRKRAARPPQAKGSTVQRKRQATISGSSAQHLEDRSALEDMEMETKTYTEPLPTSQQAYKSHHLYALERWLTKYQTLHPKGPVLGYCAGQPVYPRTCVQILHTPDRWLREGLRVREGEAAAKVVKANHLATKSVKQATTEFDGEEEKPPPPTTELFGRWQCDPWRPPAAVNGIVPKNERGQIDCWSEFCIPPGTVHLRFPRLVPIVKRLGIDFAPAMVGFEIRKKRSVPMYEGVVVCVEFKDVIMDAYRQEEERRFGELRRKRQDVAIRRWRELLHSMATRERLKAAYEGFPRINTESKKAPQNSRKTVDMSKYAESVVDAPKKKAVEKQEVAHVHHFPEENQTYDEETGTRTKVCSCGFTVHVEEM